MLKKLKIVSVPKGIKGNAKILQHPNIPEPMHGLNPRTIMGQTWWNKQRNAAYEKKDFHCWACGVHKSNAQLRKWLEGHEEYKINYAKGRMVFKRVVALCHFCHSFIHSGRLQICVAKGKFSRQYGDSVLEHGLRVLDSAGLVPWVGTVEVIMGLAPTNGYPGFDDERLREMMVQAAPKQAPKIAKWEDWRLVLEDKEYPPFYKTMKDLKEAFK